MPRPRLPTAVLQLRGAFRVNPGRLNARKNEPLVLTRLPEPPEHLSKAIASVWNEIRTLGWWLTSADRYLVEIAATLTAGYRGDTLKSGDVSMLIGLLGKIGFSPKERARMNLPTGTT
jgi:hypothetical protein